MASVFEQKSSEAVDHGCVDAVSMIDGDDQTDSIEGSIEAFTELVIVNSSTEDDGSKIVVVEEVVTHIEDHYATKPEAAPVSKSGPHGLFHRLTSGGMFMSQKKKCLNIVTKGIARGAPSVPKNSLKGSYHKAGSIPTKLLEKDGICEYILKVLTDINCQTLVQEKWLAETRHLLNDEIFSIGVFGRHKAGKSTALNALLHQEILPSAVTNETATLTEIYHDKSKHISVKNCAKENCQMCPIMGKVCGRRNIRNSLQEINTLIRENGKPPKDIQHNFIQACVPFMSPYSTGNIQVVLMDTPGLAEANELGITDIAEHQLMTCSAYIYVISCTQLEDEIDTETLKAIVERDPGIFIHKLMLIVVTRLDEYKEARKRTNDSLTVPEDSDDEDDPDFEGLIRSIKELVKHQFQSICEVPDECIIPVSAKGALEARKVIHGEKSKEVRQLLLKFEERVGKAPTVEELEEFSQVPILEERLGVILSLAYPVWRHSIVRDCSRYLQTVISELQNTKHTLKEVEKDFAMKEKSKVKKWKHFKEEGRRFKAKYEHGSQFHRSLEFAYNVDIESHRSFIETKCEDEFFKFDTLIRQKKQLTSKEYREECEKFLDKANKSLMSDFEHLQFQTVNEVIKESYYRLGKNCTELENLMAAFCEARSIVNENENSIQARSDTVTASLDNAPVRTAPLELKELLAYGKSVDYTMLDKMKILAQRIFLRITLEDPERKLLDIERDALLEELRTSLLEDSKKYFSTIKEKIINGYVEEQVKRIEKQMSDLKRTYNDGIEEMKERLAYWHDAVDTYKTMADEHKHQIEFLKQLQIHLADLSVNVER